MNTLVKILIGISYGYIISGLFTILGLIWYFFFRAFIVGG